MIRVLGYEMTCDHPHCRVRPLHAATRKHVLTLATTLGWQLWRLDAVHGARRPWRSACPHHRREVAT